MNAWTTTVDLLEFCRAAAFGPLALGMTNRTVHTLIGPPDQWGSPWRRQWAEPTLWQSALWKYGDFELHFHGPKQRHSLWLIHLDNGGWGGGGDRPGIPAGGRNLPVTPWVIHAGMSVGAFSAALDAVGIVFKTIDWPLDDNTTRLRMSSGVGAVFINRKAAHSSPPGLCMLSLPGDGE